MGRKLVFREEEPWVDALHKVLQTEGQRTCNTGTGAELGQTGYIKVIPSLLLFKAAILLCISGDQIRILR
jgi:hypothetical protein